MLDTLNGRCGVNGTRISAIFVSHLSSDDCRSCLGEPKDLDLYAVLKAYPKNRWAEHDAMAREDLPESASKKEKGKLRNKKGTSTTKELET